MNWSAVLAVALAVLVTATFVVMVMLSGGVAGGDSIVGNSIFRQTMTKLNGVHFVCDVCDALCARARGFNVFPPPCWFRIAVGVRACARVCLTLCIAKIRFLYVQCSLCVRAVLFGTEPL